MGTQALFLSLTELSSHELQLVITSVQAAQASKDTDKRAIDQLVTEAFGRIEDADELVRTLLLTYQRELRGRYAEQDGRDVADQR